jgi:hypothetical protein
MPPTPEPLPALTRAECDVIDHYLAVVDLMGRINPARVEATYGVLRAAQALVGEAKALRDAVTVMYERGETDVSTATLRRALQVLDGEKRIARLSLTPPAGRS